MTTNAKEVKKTESTEKLEDAGVTKEKSPKRVMQARKRIPLGTRNVLTAAERPGYCRRFVNDVGDRVDRFKDAGWTPVKATPVGDDKAGKATSMGSMTNVHVGKGQRAVLMEIKEDLYEEDQKVKQEKIDAVEKEMTRTKPGADGLSGEVKITR